MVVFADVDTLQDGWRTLESDELKTAETLIKRASAYLTAILKRHNITIDAADEVQCVNLETVCCNMVRRVFDSPDGITQMTQGIGATNGSVSFNNPDKSFYLTQGDKAALGLVGNGGVFFVHAHTYADDLTAVHNV